MTPRLVEQRTDGAGANAAEPPLQQDAHCARRLAGLKHHILYMCEKSVARPPSLWTMTVPDCRTYGNVPNIDVCRRTPQHIATCTPPDMPTRETNKTMCVANILQHSDASDGEKAPAGGAGEFDTTVFGRYKETQPVPLEEKEGFSFGVGGWKGVFGLFLEDCDHQDLQVKRRHEKLHQKRFGLFRALSSRFSAGCRSNQLLDMWAT